MAHGRQLHPDLVGAACQQAHKQQALTRAHAQGAHKTERLAAVGLALCCRAHLFIALGRIFEQKQQQLGFGKGPTALNPHHIFLG